MLFDLWLILSKTCREVLLRRWYIQLELLLWLILLLACVSNRVTCRRHLRLTDLLLRLLHCPFWWILAVILLDVLRLFPPDTYTRTQNL